MKMLKPLLLTFAFLLISSTTQAQFWKKLEKKVEDATERAIIRKTEQKVTKETEKGMDSILNPNTGKKRKKKSRNRKNNETSSENDSNQNSEENVAIENSKAWSTYNFVPRDEIIFEDDLKNEENGEFPSRWDLIKGNAENASFMEENVIRMYNGTKITPLMEEALYLPDVFTIEFDALFKSVHGPTYQDYRISLWPASMNYGYSEDKKYYCKSINLNMHGASMDCVDNKAVKKYASYNDAMVAGVGEPVWRHIAIAFNKRSLKVFIDENRALNIPNVKFKPEAFSIEVFAYYKELSGIKNIRVAKGGKDLYDRVLADGKFVTRGILFDVNKATIQKESYGVLNEVAKMMKAHKDLNFKIEGHTDSDGADDYNLKLSADRAIAVKNALQEMGISKDRFQTEGKGETAPVSDNTSPEGKANNRRVEFIKIK
ncbi:OmpA family protein [Rasiella sp. SM2506]|uniref:OmpA family protein n=1 Tax=Rasiella sp. SM2506 TaxID=3423914 RepID=UPI003D7B6B27